MSRETLEGKAHRAGWYEFATSVVPLADALAELDLVAATEESYQASVNKLLLRVEELERNNAELLYNYEKQVEANRRGRDKRAQLEQQNAALKADLEQGFMRGAYARLKNLQEAERQLVLTREALRFVIKNHKNSMLWIDVEQGVDENDEGSSREWVAGVDCVRDAVLQLDAEVKNE